jgi:hypothetical protein
MCVRAYTAKVPERMLPPPSRSAVEAMLAVSMTDSGLAHHATSWSPY